MLQKFWLELRAKAPGCEGGAVTMRQLESLLRLAEARARCELRPVVTRVSWQTAQGHPFGQHVSPT